MIDDFDEYIRQGEPSQKEKSQIWQIAIGLQQVDGLTPSAYLIETAKQNIEGDITIEEVKKRIDAYYKEQPLENDSEQTEEADKVSARIAEILSEKTFSFSSAEYLNIHKRLFAGIYKFAGKIRDYNITKSEWVLNGDTVLYASANTLKETIEHDFEQEKNFNYKGLTTAQIVEHIAGFTTDLWQIHIFGEGNTRTTAVFLIKYLRKLGFKEINNDMFARHSWYFRNALVRANYQNIAQNIHRTNTYLVRFLSNILLNENNILKNREMHIHFVENVEKDDTVYQNGGVNGGVKLTETQKKIVTIIGENNTVTQAEIARKIEKPLRTIENNIKKLKEQGIISRVGSDKKGSWIITSKENSNNE
ncbi:MAG: Fic family protein [Bacteroidales bacterium]|jgi:fido (protein-threonine AMPylation protein)/DNA-binding MarR family transcriptional regulator|nr:Fic family protein [Bacteroidales bacterium]